MQVMENLRCIQHAPSVQMQEVSSSLKSGYPAQKAVSVFLHKFLCCDELFCFKLRVIM